MWCNVGVAEQVKFSCKVGFFDLLSITNEDKQRFNKKTIKFLVDTDEMVIFNNSDDNELSVIHGIGNSIDIKKGINKTGASLKDLRIKKLLKKIIKESKTNEKQLVIKTPEELLLKYKETFFIYPLTGVFRDFIEMEDGSKITFKDVKDFSERKFFKMPVADFLLKEKLSILYVEYKNAVKQNKQSYIDNIKKIKEEEEEGEKIYKEKMERKWGKVFHYFSHLELSSDQLILGKKTVTYSYKGHVYWGGYKRKGFVIEIYDNTVIEKKNLKNFFDRQIKSSWTYQFNFSCK